MLRKTLIALVVIIAGFAVYVALQPGDYRIVRSATMAAPSANVFAQVNDFHKWEAWSPWAKLDPAAKYTFEGPSAGTGAIFKWSGNDRLGEGMKILTESRPNEFIRIKLDFFRPFEATSNMEFAFKSEENQTNVTWTLIGRKGFANKAVYLFTDMGKMVGDQFEKGLESIKAIVEENKDNKGKK